MSVALSVAIGSPVFALLAGQGVDSTSAQKSASKMPLMHDGALRVELVAEGLKFPTSMSFVDNGDILVLQKNDGQVRLVSAGQIVQQPVLQAKVASGTEEGLLGIATRGEGSSTEAFIYLTENVTGKLVNRIYKYEWSKKSLVNGTPVLDLGSGPGPYHNGGKVKIGPDGYLYAVTGDLTDSWSVLDNEGAGRGDDYRSAIARIDSETGQAPADNPFYNEKGFEKVFAYGIRNSFGMDFDPVTGYLWITENGPDKYDEINVVRPGFDSGWDRLSGPMVRSNATLSDLVMLDGAYYSDPVFSWQLPVGVTDISFFDSDRLGERYRDNIFVGDINNGNLYFFQVNQNRTGLQLGGNLSDLVADMYIQGNDTKTEAPPLVIGEGFGRITDIETGPDGYLYILTYEDGRIYRIT